MIYFYLSTIDTKTHIKIMIIPLYLLYLIFHFDFFLSFPFSKPRVKDQLLSHGLQLEEFGGDVQAVEISALTVSDVSDLHPVHTIDSPVYTTRAEFENAPKILRLEVGFTRCNVIHSQCYSQCDFSNKLQGPL